MNYGIVAMRQGDPRAGDYFCQAFREGDRNGIELSA